MPIFVWPNSDGRAEDSFQEIREKWSDSARLASIAARRRKIPSTTNQSVTSYQEKEIQALAKSHGMAPAEYKKAVDTHIKKLLSKAEVNVRVPEDHLEKILDSGKIKTSHETSSHSFELERNSRTRADLVRQENKILGVNKNAPNEARPVYGFLAEGKEGRLDETGWNELSSYGNVTIRLVDSVKKRTSFTGDDTFANNTPDKGRQKFHAVDLTDPKEPHRAMLFNSKKPYQTEADPLKMKSVNDTATYFEAQIHGGVKTEHVKEVLFGSTERDWSKFPFKMKPIEGYKPPKILTDRLDKLKIPWRVVGYPK